MEYPPIYRVYEGKTYTAFTRREAALDYFNARASATRVTADYGNREVRIR